MMRLVSFWAVGALVVCGCRQPTEPKPSERPAVDVPATQPTSAPAVAQPAERQRIRVVWPGPAGRQADWLAIEALDDPHKQGWAEARLIHRHRLEVRTHNVKQLRLELGRLPGRAMRRLILQIDGQGIEITGARGLTIRLLRSKAGAWDFAR